MNFNKLRSYIKEDEFEIRILKNKVDVLNYESIGHFDSNKVIIRHQNGSLVIKGEHLVVSKLLNDEVLVTGIIKIIELRWLYEEFIFI